MYILCQYGLILINTLLKLIIKKFNAKITKANKKKLFSNMQMLYHY